MTDNLLRRHTAPHRAWLLADRAVSKYIYLAHATTYITAHLVSACMSKGRAWIAIGHQLIVWCVVFVSFIAGAIWLPLDFAPSYSFTSIWPFVTITAISTTPTQLIKNVTHRNRKKSCPWRMQYSTRWDLHKSQTRSKSDPNLYADHTVWDRDSAHLIYQGENFSNRFIPSIATVFYFH